MSDPWFRWYNRTCEDGKLRAVARNANVTVAAVIGVWASLLEDASHPTHRGISTRGRRYHEAVLDLSVEVLDTIIHEMDSMDLVSSIDGQLHITAWKQRQYETDTVDPTNAMRQQKWRERRKANGITTEHNGHVTEAKRPDTDTDTDTEKERSREFVLANGRKVPLAGRTKVKKEQGDSGDFKSFWEAFPRHEDKEHARQEYTKALKKVSHNHIMAALNSKKPEWARNEPKYTPKAGNWLKKGGWADEPMRPAQETFSGIT